MKVKKKNTWILIFKIIILRIKKKWYIFPQYKKLQGFLILINKGIKIKIGQYLIVSNNNSIINITNKKILKIKVDNIIIISSSKINIVIIIITKWIIRKI